MARWDLGNRASPVDRAHMKRPQNTLRHNKLSKLQSRERRSCLIQTLKSKPMRSKRLRQGWHNPRIANRTFGNRTQSNSIELNPSIEFDWVRQSNQIQNRNLCEYDFRTNRTQSNKSNLIVLNPLDCVRLSSATEHNRTQSIGVCSTVSGGWICLKRGHVMWCDFPLGYFS